MINEVSQKEVMQLFEWVNDNDVRFWSFNSYRITFEEHSKWFSEKLADENYLMYIFKIGINPIGLVRLEKINEKVILSYLLDYKFRGNGYAVKTIKLAINSSRVFCSNLDIFAFTKSKNIASIKTLERSGFFFEKQTINKLVFKLNMEKS